MKHIVASIIFASIASTAQAGGWGFDNFDMNPNMNWGNNQSWGNGPMGFNSGNNPSWNPMSNMGWNNGPAWGNTPGWNNGSSMPFWNNGPSMPNMGWNNGPSITNMGWNNGNSGFPGMNRGNNMPRFNAMQAPLLPPGMIPPTAPLAPCLLYTSRCV